MRVDKAINWWNPSVLGLNLGYLVLFPGVREWYGMESHITR